MKFLEFVFMSVCACVLWISVFNYARLILSFSPSLCLPFFLYSIVSPLNPFDLTFEIFIYLCIAWCQYLIEIRIIRIALIHSFVRSFLSIPLNSISFVFASEWNRKSKPQNWLSFRNKFWKSFQVALKVAGMRPHTTLIIYVMWGNEKRAKTRATTT